MATSLFLSTPHFPFSSKSKPYSPNPNPLPPFIPSSSKSPISTEALRAKSDLLNLISDQERGIKTQQNPSRRTEIIDSIETLASHGDGTVTTGPSLSARGGCYGPPRRSSCSSSRTLAFSELRPVTSSRSSTSRKGFLTM